MQTISLPRDSAFFQLRVELEGTSYILDFAWNARIPAWLMSVADADGEVLVEGITIPTNRLLLRRFKADARLPLGDLMAADPTHSIDAPGYDQLGTDVELYYFTAAEIAGTDG